MNRLPFIVREIMATLGRPGVSLIKIPTPRPAKLARELARELQMCHVTPRGGPATGTPGIVIVRFKDEGAGSVPRGWSLP